MTLFMYTDPNSKHFSQLVETLTNCCYMVYSYMDSWYSKWTLVSLSKFLLAISEQYFPCQLLNVLYPRMDQNKLERIMEKIILTYQSCCRNEFSSRLIIYMKTFYMPTLLNKFLVSETYICSHFNIFEIELWLTIN